jgi:hypothetical protein
MGKKTKPVMVTTKLRGVFFGYLQTEPSLQQVTLTDCRMCIRWRDMKGLPDLAKSGPNSNCKVSAAAPEATIYDLTAIFECTPEAVKKWESEPWG